MPNEIINKIENFLMPTKYCDCDNKKIINLARKLTVSAKDDQERAVILFDFVKKRYLYSFGNWKIKASDFIGKRRGMCTTKANLFVALSRSLGIPTGFRIIRMNAQNVFKIFAKLDYLHQKMSTNSVHIFSSVFFDGKWVDVDTSLDPWLAKGLEKIGYGNNLAGQWDGKNNFVNFIPRNEIISDLGLFSNIDEYHEKKRRTATFLFTIISNINIAYYRLLGKL